MSWSGPVGKLEQGPERQEIQNADRHADDADRESSNTLRVGESASLRPRLDEVRAFG